MGKKNQATDRAAIRVLRIVEEGGYKSPTGFWVSIQDAQAATELGTQLYTPETLSSLLETPSPEGESPVVRWMDATTQEAASRLAPEASIAVLNFASARNPGGGFLSGATAQEEELCRCSGLYPTLLKQPEYYKANRAQRSLFYTDHIIYSPAVPFFRKGARTPFLSDPFLASVITAPAPNAGAMVDRDSEVDAEIRATFLRRWQNVLAVAEQNQIRVLVLGAWGCGAFGNDPSMVAETAREALSKRSAGLFDRVVFAIPGSTHPGRQNLAAFRAVLQKPLEVASPND